MRLRSARIALPRIALAAALLAAALTAGCHRAGEVPPTDAPVTPTGPGALRADWGAVLPDRQASVLLHQCSRPSPEGLAGHWTPTHRDLARLETRLAPLLDSALDRVILEDEPGRPRASDYYRQYGPFYAAGRRVIYVNGLHHDAIMAMDQHDRPDAYASAGSAPRPRTFWQRQALVVCEGGLTSFGVLYDAESETLGMVLFNDRRSGPVRLRSP